jgi:hypothetical protein
MATVLTHILRAATRQEGGPLNILTFPTHEAYETNLAKTGHNFWAYRGPGIKDWNAVYRPVPSNYTLMDPLKGDDQIPDDIAIDLVLSQNKFGQYQVAKRFSQQFQLPLINLEHTEPMQAWGQGRIERLRQMTADIEVYISEYSRSRWGASGRVVHHGIDSEFFTPDPSVCRKPILLSVVNDWVKRDWCCGFELWKAATAGLPVFVVGDTPGLSRPAKTVDDLLWMYQSAMVFVNTSIASPIPTVLLEAMAAGCAVVTTNTGMIPDVVKHEVNGLLISPDPGSLRLACERLLGSPSLCERLGAEARRTIVEKFSVKAFVDNWNSIFDEAIR